MSFNTNSYRYGFNGQEKSTEIDPNGNLNTAEYWEYDGRIGRRWNIDPVIKPWESGYATFADDPTVVSDPNGDDGKKSEQQKDPDCPECTGIIAHAVTVKSARIYKTKVDNTGVSRQQPRDGYFWKGRYFIPPMQPTVKPAKLNGFAAADMNKDAVNQFYYHLVDDPYVTFRSLFDPTYDHTHLGGRYLSGEDGTNAFASTAPLLLGGETKLFDFSEPLSDAELLQNAAIKAEAKVGGTGRFAGTAKHTYANNLLKRYQSIYGDRGLQFNYYFNNNGLLGPGNRGFLDVVNHNTQIIFDFKFGNATMGTSQESKYLRNFPGYKLIVIKP